jgi:phosphate transport system substrate-binding protein
MGDIERIRVTYTVGDIRIPNMKTTIRAALLIVLLSVFAGDFAIADLKITGSSTIYPIVKDAKIFFERQTGQMIDLRGGGSEVGIGAIVSGAADLAMVSRDLLPGDDPRLQNFPIAYDGIALIVHASNNIAAITKPQVVSIYTGKIDNWNQLGGDDRPITVIAKRQGHGTKTRFDNYFGLADRVIKNAFLFDSNNESIAMVGSDPAAIGYVSIGSAEYAINLNIRIKLLDLDGGAATSEGIASGRYPLRRTLNLVTLDAPKPEAMKFIQYMQHVQGQEFVRKKNFVPLPKDAQ